MIERGPISKAIMERRSIYPKLYNSTEIPDETIRYVLDHANRAPSHRHTEPWRFVVFKNDSLNDLSEYLSDWYVTNTPEDKFSQRKFDKTKNKPFQCGAVIAIVMQRDLEEKVPEWEEIAAVSCAVQNMYLICHELEIGCYWSTPKAILEANEFLDLARGQRCLGLFYMGYRKELPALTEKGDISARTHWRKPNK